MQSTKSLPNGNINIAEFKGKTESFEKSRFNTKHNRSKFFCRLVTLQDLLRWGGCSAPETGTLRGISTAAAGKDILGISAGAVVVIGVPGFGAVACVADADAAAADADPRFDCDATLSWTGMLKALIWCIFVLYSPPFDDLNTT